MAKKPVFAASSTPLPGRIERACKEGRFQQALELSRQQYKHDPSEAHLATLRQVSLERARQLQSQGHLKEAATIFANAWEMNGPASFQAKLLEGLAVCGDVAKTFSFLGRLDDPAARVRVLGHVADQAVQRPNEVRPLLPPDLAAQLDAVLLAFAHFEHARDDDARAVLGGIGLQSPFLEWKVLLRGLLAYHTQDDVRALENWQRLDAGRFPSRVAAPFRFRIDSAFRAAQPAAAQALLARQAARIQDDVLGQPLRAVQKDLANDEGLPQAFRKAEAVLPFLKQQAPALVGRLASCFRRAIVNHGLPEDLPRFSRVFGVVADDPRLNRLQALALEQRAHWQEAQRAWIEFDKDIARAEKDWPPDQARHMRALLWQHLGQLAADHEGEEIVNGDFFRPAARTPVKFDLSADACFRRSLEFVPDALPTLEALFEHARAHATLAQSFKAGLQLLEHHPGHVPTLEAMAELAAARSRFDQAQEFLERALKVNPLHRELRGMLAVVHQFRARFYSIDNSPEGARTHVSAALSLVDDVPVRCLAAIVELKAGNPAPQQELLDKNDPAAAYGLLCEAIRQELPPRLKKPFTTAFAAVLKGTPAPAVTLELVSLVLRQREPTYHGQKTHEKKILALAGKISLGDLSEKDLACLCFDLRALKASKPWMRAYQHGQKSFPENPTFLLEEGFFLLEKKRNMYVNSYRLNAILRQARPLIEKLPRGPRQDFLRESLESIETAFRELEAPFPFSFPRFFDDDCSDDDDYDDDM